MSRRAKILIAFGKVLIVAILIPVIHHYRLRAATEAYICEDGWLVASPTKLCWNQNNLRLSNSPQFA